MRTHGIRIAFFRLFRSAIITAFLSLGVLSSCQVKMLRQTDLELNNSIAVTSVTLPSRNYSVFNFMTVTATFNGNVTVDTTGGTPFIQLTINGVNRNATYLSGSGTNALRFRYVVPEGETATAGQVSMDTEISLNSGTIRDVGNRTPTLTFEPPATNAITLEYRYPDAGAGTARKIHKIAMTRDGTGDFYICGRLTSYRNVAGTNNVSYGRVMRMNEDLSPDTTNTTFNAAVQGGGFDGEVSDCEVARDGTNDLFVAGDFDNYNGVSSPKIARLRPDGSLVTTFATNIGTGPQELAVGGNGLAGRSYAILPLPDGSLFLGGTFQRFNGNTIFSRLIKLNGDGTPNAVFQNYVTTAGDSIASGNGSFVVFSLSQVPVDANSDGVDDGTGNILVVGSFYSYAFQNHGHYGGTGLGGFAMIQTDGTFVGAPTWNTGSGARVHAGGLSYALPGGKFLVGGLDQFNDFNGTAVKSAVRINADGSLDTTFDTGTGPLGYTNVAMTVRRMLPLSDGRIVMAGEFHTYDGLAVKGAVLLTSTGAIDAGHAALFGSGVGANEGIGALTLLSGSGNTFVMGGDFTQINGTTNRRTLWKLTVP